MYYSTAVNQFDWTRPTKYSKRYTKEKKEEERDQEEVLTYQGHAVSIGVRSYIFLGGAGAGCEALLQVLLALHCVDQLLAALQLALQHGCDVEHLQRVL